MATVHFLLKATKEGLAEGVQVEKGCMFSELFVATVWDM